MTVWGAASQPPPAAPRVNVVPVVTAAPAPTMQVVDVPDGDAAMDELARLAGWGGCPVWRPFDVDATVGPRSVEAAIRASGHDRGFLDVPDASGVARRIWVGGDILAAATAFGGSFVVREADAGWTVVPWEGGQAGVRLRATARRDGGPYWQVSGRAVPAPYCIGRGAQFEGPIRILHVPGRPAGRRCSTRPGGASCKTWERASSQMLPSSAAIERAAASELITPDGHGWIDLPAESVGGDRPLRAWIGRDTREVARAHGSGLLVTGDADPAAAWLRVDFDGSPAAIELRRVETSGGWTAWIPTPNAAGLTGVLTPADRP